MGKAIRYAIGRWEALGRFVEDGRFELDNNVSVTPSPPGIRLPDRDDRGHGSTRADAWVAGAA
jgi:hypothetical protein